MARYSIVKRHRDYYKYGTELNATVVGSFAKIDKGVVNGFTTANYLTYLKAFNISTADNWEMECKFTTGSNITTQQQILSSSIFASAGNSCGAFIRVYSSKIQFIVPLTSNISSYISLEYTATINTEYVVKGEFTGTAYNLYVNGELVATKESTSKGLYNVSYNDRLYIGTSTDKSYPFLGSIDLTQSYIKINGKDWWHGTKAVESTEADADYHVDSNKLYSFTRRQRKYYKDGVEVPSSSITDFGSYKYFKNVVTTKYWKEITTGSREIEYYCYTYNGCYVYATKDLKTVKQSATIYMQKVTDSNNLTYDTTSYCRNITIDSLQYNLAAITGGSIWEVFSRSYNDDLYKDTTTTTRVEVTVYDDWDYTTEETVTVEVTADDEYDFTEFVPSAEFDYYTDRNVPYNIMLKR